MSDALVASLSEEPQRAIEHRVFPLRGLCPGKLDQMPPERRPLNPFDHRH